MSRIVLLALAGAFQMLVLQPLQQEVSFMRSHLEGARTKTSMQSRTFSLGDRQKELGMFIDSLPDEQDVTNIVGTQFNHTNRFMLSLKRAVLYSCSIVKLSADRQQAA